MHLLVLVATAAGQTVKTAVLKKRVSENIADISGRLSSLMVSIKEEEAAPAVSPAATPPLPTPTKTVRKTTEKPKSSGAGPDKSPTIDPRDVYPTDAAPAGWQAEIPAVEPHAFNDQTWEQSRELCRNDGEYFCKRRMTSQQRNQQRMSQPTATFEAQVNLGELSADLRQAAPKLGALQTTLLGMRRRLQTVNLAEEKQFNRDVLDQLNTVYSPNQWNCEPDCRVDTPPWKQERRYPYPPYLIPWPWPNLVEQPQCDNNATFTWGLDRIEATYTTPLDDKYQKECKCCGLRPTVAFVIDTGIQPHDEFGQRLLIGESREFVSTTDPLGVQAIGDTNGHGTHCAGTIGGCDVGVNACTQLVALRVFPANSGSTSISRIIRAIDYVTDKATNPNDSFHHHHKTISMSLGGGTSSSYNIAIDAAHAAGVTVVVAAGNSNNLACYYGPANVANAITVGSTTISDQTSSFSNYGDCVDIFAPGSNINSSWEIAGATSFTNDISDNYNSISGTSMATPHVAGVATLAHAYDLATTPDDTWLFINCTAFVNELTFYGSHYGDNVLLRKYLDRNWRWNCRRRWIYPHWPIEFDPDWPIETKRPIDPDWPLDELDPLKELEELPGKPAGDPKKIIAVADDDPRKIVAVAATPGKEAAIAIPAFLSADELPAGTNAAGTAKKVVRKAP